MNTFGLIPFETNLGDLLPKQSLSNPANYVYILCQTFAAGCEKESLRFFQVNFNRETDQEFLTSTLFSER